eukprot:9875757-Alexandrium_andersonii.AAC.1
MMRGPTPSHHCTEQGQVPRGACWGNHFEPRLASTGRAALLPICMFLLATAADGITETMSVSVCTRVMR